MVPLFYFKTMAFFIQIFDSNGNPEPITNFSDLITNAILDRGVGFLRTSKHVEQDIRDVIQNLFRSKIVVLEAPKITQTCEGCSNQVGVWHTYPDGKTICTLCKEGLNGD